MSITAARGASVPVGRQTSAAPLPVVGRLGPRQRLFLALRRGVTVRAAAARATPLRICGGGTKDFLACRLEGEPLPTAGLTGIVAYEPSELVVTVRAGTPLAELEAALASQGQCLPFEPPRFGLGGTVGGMVACGISGPARASVGAVRDYVLGLEMVNGGDDLLLAVAGGGLQHHTVGAGIDHHGHAVTVAQLLHQQRQGLFQQRQFVGVLH